MRRGWIVMAALAALCLVAAPALADLKDFVDADKAEAGHDACEKQVNDGCLPKCKSAQDEDCLTKCWAKGAMCAQKVVNDAFKVEKMPKKAQGLVKKLAKGRDGGMNNCGKSAAKCGKKCKDSKCLNKCSMSWLDCSNKVQQKYRLNDKKLAEILKGKKP